MTLAFCSCGVLEDRRDCPCILTIDLSDPANAICDSVYVLLCTEGRCIDTLAYGAEVYPYPQYVTVSNRSGVYLDVSDKAQERYCSCDGFLIPKGEDCPQAWLHSSFCDTSGGECQCSVKLHKEYCGIALTFVSANPQKYKLRVSGLICGYGIDGSLKEGEFLCTPEFDGNNRSFFRVPRQTDPTLMLEITSPDGTERAFALGSYIERSGYDWTKENLDDIAVSVDYSSTEVAISVNDWQTVEYYDIVI